MISFLVGLLMMMLGASALPPASSASTSSNWSGYGQPRGSYQYVGAEWTVPVLDCAVTPGGVVSVWVGVNGWGDHPGLFQDGTSSYCVNGQQGNITWWTDEAKGYAGQEVFPVTTGDVVYARVWEEASGHWAYSVRDLTTGQSSSLPESSSLYGSAATAEWIVEDPVNMNTNKPCRLADFGTVHFSHGQYTATRRQPKAEAIKMIIRSSGMPQAVPSVVKGGSWDVSYEG